MSTDTPAGRPPRAAAARAAGLACALLVTTVTSSSVVSAEGIAGPPGVPAVSAVTSAATPATGGVASLAHADMRALLNWALRLSRYVEETEVPEVRLESQAFFERNACGGRPGACRVLGWYADRGVVHVHERLGELDSLFARSLVVHELVHYLQHRSGRFASGDCESFVAREREAYAVQQAFFVAHGSLPEIRPHHFACPDAEDALRRAAHPGT